MSATKEAVIAIAEAQQQQAESMIDVLEQAIKVLRATNDSIDKLVAIVKASS